MSSRKISRKKSVKKRARSASRPRNMQYHSSLVRLATPEKKYLDNYHASDLTSDAADAQNVVSNFLVMSAGGAVNQRIGNRIMLRNINIRGEVFTRVPNTGDLMTYIVRVVLVQDLQCNGTTPDYEDVFRPPSAIPSAVPPTAIVSTQVTPPGS